THWQFALFGASAATLIFTVVMVVLLPRQKLFRPKKITLKYEVSAMITHWRNPRLALLFATAFLGMGTFVSLYNYLGFRMIEQFVLSEVLVGAVLLMYLSGTWSSAQAGRLREKMGNGPAVIFLAITMIVSLVLMAVDNMWLTFIALFAFTASFFAIHSS